MKQGEPDDARNAMHLLLGRLIHGYARLDHFIGLQLNWLGEYRGQPVETLLRKNVAFDRRLRALKLLAMETWGHSDPKVAGEFRAWFKEVERVQGQRNRFAHGRWGYPHMNAGEMEFVELSWETDSARAEPAARVVLKDFERLVDEVEQLAQGFMGLQKKFESRVRYKKEWEDANPLGFKVWSEHQTVLASGNCF